jgi:hypothetical protein
MKKFLPFMFVILLILSCSCTKNNDPSETSAAETLTAQTSYTETSQNTTSQTTETSAAQTSSETATTAEETTSEDETPQIDLLDYFVMPDDSERPVAIMIDNEGHNSYPQGGIEKAQIVYEMIAEFGETRLIPVFYDLSEGNVGPVRSTRHYMIQFAMEYDPIIVHIGFSPLGQRMLENNNIARINGLYKEFYSLFFDLTKDDDNWQDTYTNLKYIKNFIAKSDFRKEPSKTFPFEYADTELDGKTAENIYLVYSGSYNVGYAYDAQTGLYARYRKGTLHIERYTGDVLAAKNIIIQRVNTYPIKNDTQGRMTMDNVGTGSGYYITNGKYKEITWEKTSDFAQTSYRYADSGEKITLNEGQTWIMVVSLTSKIEIN